MAPVIHLHKNVVWKNFKAHLDALGHLQQQLREIEIHRQNVELQIESKKHAIEQAAGLPWAELTQRGLVPTMPSSKVLAPKQTHPEGSLHGKSLRSTVQRVYVRLNRRGSFTVTDVCASIEKDLHRVLSSAERKRVASVLQWDGLYQRLYRYPTETNREAIRYSLPYKIIPKRGL